MNSKLFTRAIILACCFSLSAPVFAQESVPQDDQSAMNGSDMTETQDQQAGTPADDSMPEQEPGTTETVPSTQDQAGTSGSAMPMKASTPKQACQSLLDASKRDDFTMAQNYIHIRELATQQAGVEAPMSGDEAGKSPQTGSRKMHKNKKMRKAEQAFHQMTRENMAELKNATCGNETVAADRAFVEVRTGEQTRLIPFIKQGENWLMDLRTYLSFYNERLPRELVREQVS